MEYQEQDNPTIIREGNKVMKTILNLIVYFKIDENLKDLFHFNEFTGLDEYSKDFKWPEHEGMKLKGERLTDKDVVYIQYYLAHNKHFEMGIDKIKNALIEISDRKYYHPVREYLTELEWDGEERLSQWLIKGCGVDDNIYTRDVGRKWITAAVTRIFSPGFKFDHVLVLEGKENIGKSTALRTLGEPWFTDSITLLQKETDIVAKMVGNWFIELAEMQGVGKRDKEFIKAFISCQFDEQRLAFRRDPKKYPRQSVFAGTSNNMAYLLDADGNRRFWPVDCKKIDIQWIKENKNQLFAEAKNIYDRGIYPINQDGEKLFLTGESLEISKKQQKMRLGTDEVMEEVISRYLIGKDEVTMLEILKECFNYDNKDLTNRPQSMVIGRILKKLGFEKKERKAEDGSIFKYIKETIKTQETIIYEEE